MKDGFQRLQQRIALTFRNPALLKQAFTHTSYVNEQRGARIPDNERLEFLGDAVLQLTVSEYLYRLYPDSPEGELTRLRASIVCEPSLVRFAEALEFGQVVLLGKGEEQTGGRTRPSLLADAFEAFLGALYLDQGLEAVRAFLERHMFAKLPRNGQAPMKDYKTELQEKIQQLSMGALDYRIVEEKGPAHDKEFIAVVGVGDRQLGKGIGRSKKEAEQQAASQALASFAKQDSR
ncbi:ribonuclease III [Cohnella sp. CIP 111063]|jgi:ribonuclease-3|uniref:ribonuclease III n=1 Tax=unclassified Cohnella TaxID=2636738 RepID=UPI000B8C25AC|nr:MULTISPECIES: ribonuclease III [unclassified Cohnella]OXS52585.1 ribonuclease III [Cohnella sp. CIP 111063]PRX58846.1 RNAse III [Cohnella sp. SGD-V74]